MPLTQRKFPGLGEGSGKWVPTQVQESNAWAPYSPREALGSASGISQAVLAHPGNWHLSGDLLWAGTALEIRVGVESIRHATGRPTLQRTCSYPHHLYYLQTECWEAECCWEFR